MPGVVATVLSIAKFAVTVVAVGVPVIVAVTPGPSTLTTVAPVRLVPVRVTGNAAVFKLHVAGAIVVNAGFVPTTVKSTKPVIPFGVVTLTLCVPTVVALESMAKVAVTVVAVGVPVIVAVTPVPSTLTAVAPVKFVPVRVTARLAVPSTPVLGAMVDSVGTVETAEAVNSTAPMSIVPRGAGRGLP